MFRRLANISLLLPIPGDTIFRRDVRHVRWYRSAKSLRRQAAGIFLLVFSALLVLWLLIPSPQATVITASGGQVIGYYAVGERQIVLMLVLGLSLSANMLLDFRSVFSVVNAIRDETTRKRLDLLRLTLIPEADIVAAKHRVAQVRIWRMTILIVSVRLFVVFMVFTVELFDGSGTWLIPSIVNNFQQSPQDTLLSVLVFAVYCAFFVLEPLWRVQSMTALGIAVSTRIENSALALLAGALAIFGVWIAQIFVLIGYSWIFTLFTVAALGFDITPLSQVLPAFYVLSLAAVVYWFYGYLQTSSLRRATRAAFAD